jgi:hypothetical protein
MKFFPWVLEASSSANELGGHEVDLMRSLSRFCPKKSDWDKGKVIILGDKYGY